MLFIEILKSLVVALILCLVFVLIRRLYSMSGQQNFLQRVSSVKLVAFFFVLTLTARLIYSQTFYGDRGSGSYQRIPLVKPYHIIYDPDRQYPYIYKADRHTQGIEVTRVSEYILSGDTLIGGLIPGRDERTYFLLNLQTGAFSELLESEFVAYRSEHLLPVEMTNFQQHYKEHWLWYLNW